MALKGKEELLKKYPQVVVRDNVTREEKVFQRRIEMIQLENGKYIIGFDDGYQLAKRQILYLILVYIYLGVQS